MAARKTKQLNNVSYVIDRKGKVELLPNGRVTRSKTNFYYEVSYSTGNGFQHKEYATRIEATNFINELANA